MRGIGFLSQNPLLPETNSTQASFESYAGMILKSTPRAVFLTLGDVFFVRRV